MYIRKLTINGYKNFGVKFEIEFSSGLNVIVGENGVGKSAIIDAIRNLLLEDEFGRSGISDGDFYSPFEKKATPANVIQISSVFAGLTAQEKIAYMPWTILTSEAKLTLQIENKTNNQGKYRREIWGGVSKNSIFEWELLDKIQCIYLPPLRDAEAKLREGRGSRLARLLKNLNKKDLLKAKEDQMLHPLEKKVNDFNESLSNDDTVIMAANELIRTNLKLAIGDYFGQDTVIQFSETNFNSIVESLRLLFFPSINSLDKRNLFRELSQNSLGYNNLLYLATVLAEFVGTGEDNEYLKVLLIEEPEAHLHPQLQARLLKYLEEQALKSNIQIIVTTHSPVLSSAVSIDSIVHVSKSENVPSSVRVVDCGLSETSSSFLNRWLDVTKSTLFYSKGIILVEGIAEAMVIPELASIALANYNLVHEKKLPEKLVDAGVSVVNINGIYFKHFMQLFCNLEEDDKRNIPILCAGVTDNDPPKEEMPTKDHPVKGKNHALNLMTKINSSAYCRLYSNLKTFEYDLAMEAGNLSVMIDAYLDILNTDKTLRKKWSERKEVDWSAIKDDEKKTVAYEFLRQIEDDKGVFAQALANKLEKEKLDFQTPEYIKNAVIWACGGEI